LGLGWLGLPLAKQLHIDGHQVMGSVCAIDKLHQYGELPFPVGRIEITNKAIIGDWEAFITGKEILIICIPPSKEKEEDQLYKNQMIQVIKQTPQDLKVVFTSSTGIYQNQGDTVTEQTIASPQTTSGKAVRNAEIQLLKYFGKHLTILRLGGLIGPDRHPGRFLAGNRMLRNAKAPLNLVHLSDCISYIKKVIDRDCWGELINVCASQHPVREDFYKKAATVLELPTPKFKKSDGSDFKIVDNSYSKDLLGFNYEYDDPCEIFELKHPGKISIVGAGPGDTQLLTLKAFEALKNADVLLHDNLVSEEILELASTAELIYVGRKFADKSCQKERQHKINVLLHDHYKQGKKVVRVKSGDPYIYGRAAEEARYLSEKKIPFEVIPGISAALAAANINNIPITERNKSNALMICTAHTADYSFEQLNGVAALLKAGNTLAVYMGLKSLHKLIPKLIEVCGKNDVPVNAISNVSRTNQRMISGTLGDIQVKVEQAELAMPVVFLIGVKAIKS